MLHAAPRPDDVVVAIVEAVLQFRTEPRETQGQLCAHACVKTAPDVDLVARVHEAVLHAVDEAVLRPAIWRKRRPRWPQKPG